MTALFSRRWAIEVGGEDSGTRFEGMSLSFTATYSKSADSSGTKLQVWMPGDTFRDALSVPGAIVRVLAGWRDGGAIEVGRGTVARGSLKDDRTAAEPSLSVDLHHTIRHLVRGVSVHIPGPVLASEALRQVLAQTGLPVDVVRLGRDITFARGFVASGKMGTVLRELLDGTDSEVDLSDRLRVWPKGESARVTADLWAASTGLLQVGSPNADGEIAASALLRPALRRGDVVSIESAAYRGALVVREARHQGSTRGSWVTSITGVPRG